jgi:tetratricopeptide (TPR) repeat protein
MNRYFSKAQRPLRFFLCGLSIFLFSFLLNACVGLGAITAEEYFSIGMAYFELGKFDEAEKWLNRAKMVDKTKSASEYNLGRIAFETGRYPEAAKHFESILKKDPGNIMALKSAAYTRIKTGEIEAAEKHYQTLLTLVPESADDGYNYAMVLYAMEKYAEAETVLSGYQFALVDSSDVLLLYARTQNAQGKLEAADSYAQWLADNSDPKVRWEYAQILEKQEFYARALEEYRSALSGLSAESVDPKKNDVHLALARVLLIADSESAEGITQLETALSDGFDDIPALEELLKDDRISADNKNSLRTVINNIERAALEKAEAAKKEEAQAEQEEIMPTDQEKDSETNM